MNNNSRSLVHGGDSHRAGIWAVEERFKQMGWRKVVEVQSKPEKREMAKRLKFYLDTWPPKADRFVIIPLWKLEKKDSISALRELVKEYLP